MQALYDEIRDRARAALSGPPAAWWRFCDWLRGSRDGALDAAADIVGDILAAIVDAKTDVPLERQLEILEDMWEWLHWTPDQLPAELAWRDWPASPLHKSSRFWRYMKAARCRDSSWPKIKKWLGPMPLAIVLKLHIGGETPDQPSHQFAMKPRDLAQMWRRRDWDTSALITHVNNLVAEERAELLMLLVRGGVWSEINVLIECGAVEARAVVYEALRAKCDDGDIEQYIDALEYREAWAASRSLATWPFHGGHLTTELYFARPDYSYVMLRTWISANGYLPLDVIFRSLSPLVVSRKSLFVIFDLLYTVGMPPTRREFNDVGLAFIEWRVATRRYMYSAPQVRICTEHSPAIRRAQFWLPYLDHEIIRREVTFAASLLVHDGYWRIVATSGYASFVYILSRLPIELCCAILQMTPSKLRPRRGARWLIRYLSDEFWRGSAL